MCAKWLTNCLLYTVVARLARNGLPNSFVASLCSGDPAVINPWFDLVQNTKRKYGILDEDIYNFDETGFTTGVAGSVKVVTASERRNWPINFQTNWQS
jgi:hypothetical protein